MTDGPDAAELDGGEVRGPPAGWPGWPEPDPAQLYRDHQPASTTYLASKAKTTGELLTVMKVIVPVALVVIALVLLVIAILRRHQPAAAPAATLAAGSDETQPESTRLDANPPR